jgi:DNA-binding NtrC family response regulator
MASSPKILVVDDESEVLEAVKNILESEGYKVITADDGKTGLREIRASLPDLLITDIVMKDMEGIEFLKAVHKEYKELPIIVMSGHAVGSRFFKAAQLFGARASLLKPFSKSELIGAVAQSFHR